MLLEMFDSFEDILDGFLGESFQFEQFSFLAGLFQIGDRFDL